MRIILDMDSILANLDVPWVAEINRRFGDSLTVDDVVTWDMHTLSKGGVAVYDILATPGFFRSLKPHAGSIEAARELVARGHEVHVVTASEFEAAASEKVGWFHEHLPFLGKRRLWIGHDKHMLHADAIVDDGPHNAKAYKEAHPNAKVLTISYPYNKDCPHYDVIAPDHNDTVAAWETILKELP